MKLYKIESYHVDPRGSVLPRMETFVRAGSWSAARAYAAGMFNVPEVTVLLSQCEGMPPVDALILEACRAA